MADGHIPRNRHRWRQSRNLSYLLRDGDVCAYCGEIATSVDHVFPWRQVGEDTPLVPACVECNSIGGANLFETFDEKRDYIQAEIMKKYAKILRCDFVEEELIEFGPVLGLFVRQGLTQRAIILERISYDFPPHYLSNVRYTWWAE